MQMDMQMNLTPRPVDNSVDCVDKNGQPVDKRCITGLKKKDFQKIFENLFKISRPSD